MTTAQKKRMHWLLLIFFLPLSLHAEDLKIRGLVIDAKSSAPLSDAVVSASGNLARYDAITDHEGVFLLPLINSAKPGNLLRIRVEREGYLQTEVQLAASNDTVSTIRLNPDSKKEASVIIDQVLFLDGDNGGKTIELRVSNNSNVVAWFQKLMVQGELALKTHGVTGFLTRVDYDLSLQASAHGNIIGKAKPLDLPGPAYEIQGNYRYIFSDDERSWRVAFSTNFPVRIDGGDKILVRLNLKGPIRKLREEQKQGEMLAASISGVLREKLTISLIADNGKVVSWAGKDPQNLLEWLSSSPKQ